MTNIFVLILALDGLKKKLAATNDCFGCSCVLPPQSTNPTYFFHSHLQCANHNIKVDASSTFSPNLGMKFPQGAH
jgi:hypothetical protein